MPPSYSLMLVLFAAAGLWLVSPVEAQDATTPLERSAIEFVGLMERRDFAAAAARFDSTMSELLPPIKLEETWDGVEGQVGHYRRWSNTTSGKIQGYDYVVVTSSFENALLDIRVVFDQQGRIAGLFFQPHVDEVALEAAPLPPGLVERETSVGEGEWVLPGTLTLPDSGRPFAAVVLVHGSGPNDRDETVGANKPFRDLAWGLARRGIAVLRYEKRTRQYRERLVDSTVGFTVDQETIEDAVAAVDLLRHTPEIDPDRIIVLGHSLGGMLAPRIGGRDPGVAGLVIMAGPTRPLQDLIIDQMRYLADLDSTVTSSERVRQEQIEQEAGRLLSLTEADSLSTDVILGANPSYWLDLAGYDPVATAEELSMPMLILHAGRDYQVTETDFARWRNGFAGDPRVTLKVYPELNHLFIAGEGPSQPSEYNIAGHVADEVMDDIADWITALPVTH